MPFILSAPIDPGTGSPPGSTASWTEFAGAGGLLNIVYTQDVNPAAGLTGINIQLPAGTVTGGEILSVILVQDDSVDPITPGANSLITNGVAFDAGTGFHQIRLIFPDAGLTRAGDGVLAVRLYRPA
jgi:hypothetical protein